MFGPTASFVSAPSATVSVWLVSKREQGTPLLPEYTPMEPETNPTGAALPWVVAEKSSSPPVVDALDRRQSFLRCGRSACVDDTLPSGSLSTTFDAEVRKSSSSVPLSTIWADAACPNPAKTTTMPTASSGPRRING